MLSLVISGCWFIYKPDIKQGNILTLEKINRIYTGMPKETVVSILGEPILINVFNDQEMVYVYTIQPGHAPFHAEQLRIHFVNGRVFQYTTDVHKLK